MKRRRNIRKQVTEKHLDDLFSLLIRGRPNYQCEAAIVGVCSGSAGKMECSHFYSRSRRATRFDETQCCCKCSACHRYLGLRPYEFGQWIVEHLGEEDAEALKLKANQSRKRSQPQMRDLHDRMKVEWARMKKLRDEGHEDWIDFDLQGL